MKNLLLAMLFAFTGTLGAEAAAYEPYTGVNAAPAAEAAPVQAVAATPAPAPEALSPVPTAYATPYPTAAPTAVPTYSPYKAYVAPTPAPTPADPSVKVAKLSFYKPRWGLSLKGGGAVPLGDLTLYNTSGPAAGLSLLYLPTESMTVDLFTHYSSQGYKFGGGASALTIAGGGIKLAWEIMRVEALSAFAGAGAGYMAVQRTQQVPVTDSLGVQLKDAGGNLVWSPTTQSTGGIALLFCFGIGYDFNRHWGLVLDLNVMNLSLGGGTSDSLMIAQPAIGLKALF